jgi:hypothetical protein
MDSFKSKGDAAHHISKKLTQQTVRSKKVYSRKRKHNAKREESNSS